MRFGIVRGGVIAAATLLGLQFDAAADPVIYEGTFVSGGSAVGELPMDSTVMDATKADYWAFWATVGDSVTVSVNRIDGELDPIQFIYAGDFMDTNDPLLTGGTGSFSMASPAFVGFADDTNPPAVPGPWGDPEFTFTVGTTGWYTVGITSFASGPVPLDDKDYDYGITVRGNTGTPTYSPNPEPGTIVLLSGALAAAGAWRRRRAKRQQAAA